MKPFRIANLVYVQDPPCGYTYSGAYTYTGKNAYIVENVSDNGELNISAINGVADGTYPITIAATLTITDGAN